MLKTAVDSKDTKQEYIHISYFSHRTGVVGEIKI